MSTVKITDERLHQATENQRNARARIAREDMIRKIKAMAASARKSDEPDD